MAGRTYRGLWSSILPDSGGGPRHAWVTAAGVGLRGDHVSQWPGAHDRNHTRAHRGFGDISAPGTRILFLSPSVCGFRAADGTALAYGASGVSIAERGLSGTRRVQGCYHLLRSNFVKPFGKMEDEEFEEEIPYISGSGEGLMEEAPTMHASARRDEDIALDLMKFVAMTTGYGRTTSSGVGFQGTGSASKPDEYAAQLLELYGKCKAVVAGKK